MKIFTKIVLQMLDNPEEYGIIEKVGYEYQGPVALMCGASNEQKQIEQQQQGFMGQLMSQAKSIFGDASSVFRSLINTFTPTVQAGPNQQGFSPAELSARRAAVIENVGQAYKNAKAAVGNQQAAVGGGNIALPTGVNAATDASLASTFAGEQASQLNQIEQENYATGRENYKEAVAGLAQAPNVFNPAATAGNAATSSGEAAASTADQITKASQSWMQPVAGIIGSVGGAAAGGWAKGLGNQSAKPTSQG